jgi:hypothetical protein
LAGALLFDEKFQSAALFWFGLLDVKNSLLTRTKEQLMSFGRKDHGFNSLKT